MAPKMAPKWDQKGTKKAPKWDQNATKKAPKMHQNASLLHQPLLQMSPKWHPKWDASNYQPPFCKWHNCVSKVLAKW